MKPYVYIIQNKEQTHWYVGMRSANECPANADTGYWGSSKYLKALIKKTGKENWTKTVVAEFDAPEEASAHEVELLELMWDWPGRVNKNINGYIDQSDPEVKAKHKAAVTISNKKKAQDQVYRVKITAANQKKAQDPVWQANNKAGAQKRSEDPVWQANHQAGCKKRSEDPVWQANHQAGIRKKLAKPFIATSIATGEEFYCESQTCEQAKALKLDQRAVSKCLNGKRRKHKGFTFRYA